MFRTNQILDSIAIGMTKHMYINKNNKQLVEHEKDK